MAVSKFGASWIERSHEITRDQPTSVFDRIHYSTYSSTWVFAYQLTPTVNSPEESAGVQYVVGANCRGTLRSPVMLVGLKVNMAHG
jgi:hypothetical protein